MVQTGSHGLSHQSNSRTPAPMHLAHTAMSTALLCDMVLPALLESHLPISAQDPGVGVGVLEATQQVPLFILNAVANAACFYYYYCLFLL
jgi:hypothetical protein